ncbi:hypothetical protein JTE90_008660 [Oedothorax gibbosus]|uniref:Uncharacterized protein n=1 Tax=Oedothorax gibbosus TaxID=931172 RepID=A0AAV6U1N4_9ARAC|nr:hypothetical protein JTE90_008660 [Oedothorax gibbosus]
MSKCLFQQEWVEKFPWLCSVPNDTNQARCKLCLNKFSLSNMGLRAVRSHKDGKKHKQKELSMESSKSVSSFCGESETAIVDAAAAAVQVQPIPESVGKPSGDCMQTFLLKDDITRAEIMWCIHTVIGNKSLRSAEKDVKVFAQIFPDSDVAKKMQLAKSKMSYLIVHGLAYHFKQILLKEVMLAEQFVIGFDERFNKITQNQQMDLNIRFWDSVNTHVKTCYFTSVFLGRSTAKDLLEAFLGTTEHLDLKKLTLGPSMDNCKSKTF